MTKQEKRLWTGLALVWALPALILAATIAVWKPWRGPGSSSATSFLSVKLPYLRGLASWYSTHESGRITASGEPLDDQALTCAAWGWPFGTWLWVEHEGKRVKVRVNDRGPARQLYAKGRVIDLTRAAFQKLAPLDRGVIPVTVWPADGEK